MSLRLPGARSRSFVLVSCFAVFAGTTPPAHAAPIRVSDVRATAENDESTLNRRRAQWLNEMHRTAPGQNWREIEAANRMELILRRGEQPRLGSGPWTEQGSTNTTGRNWVARVSRVDPNLLYIGSANGGIFSGTVYGSGVWTPLTDDLGYGVHEMVVTPGTAPETDGFVIGDNGGRLFVSTDGAASWSVPAGLPDAVWNVRRLLVDEAAPSRVYALVDGWIWTGSWDHSWHLLRSEDSGTTFTKVHSEPIATTPDIWMDRNVGGALYLMVNGVLKRSLTLGASFTTIGTVPGGADECVLTGSEAGAPVLYAALHAGGGWTLYRSANAGASWIARSALQDFYGTLCAPRSDATQVYAGGINCYRSIFSGAGMSAINTWDQYYDDPLNKFHADIFGIHSLMVPDPPEASQGGPRADGVPLIEVLFVDTDGGTYRLLPEASASPRNITLTGLPNAQYYGIRTSATGVDVVSAGSQDQGYQVSDPRIGTSLPEFTQVISGDYGHLTSANPTNDMTWSVYPGFILLQRREFPVELEYPDFPNDDGISFLPFVLANPDDASELLFCARHLWRIRRNAPNNYSRSMDPFDFGAGANDYLTALAIAPGDHDRWYAATAQGRLYHSGDAGASWTLSPDDGPQSHYFFGTELLVSPTDPLTCYVGGSGYDGPPVYRSTDGGVAWTPLSIGLGNTLVLGMAFDNAVNQTLYAATESGPFRHNPGSGLWESLLVTECCAPLTTYWDIESLPGHSRMRFATYGRGIWDFATNSTVSAPAPLSTPDLRLAIAPNPARLASALSFDLPHAGRVRVDVFDVAGHRIATPLDGWRPAGRTELRFEHRAANGRTLDRGIYLVRVKSADGSDVRKLMIAK